jgi:hypothetical protein
VILSFYNRYLIYNVIHFVYKVMNPKLRVLLDLFRLQNYWAHLQNIQQWKLLREFNLARNIPFVIFDLHEEQIKI